MARHASGENNFKVAGWVWAVLIAVVLVTALIIGWSAVSKNNQTSVAAEECAEGDYELSVWAAPQAKAAAEELAKAYNDADRIVADHCVTASISEVADRDGLSKLDSEVPAAWVPEGAAAVLPAAKDHGVRAAGNDVPNVGEPARPVLRLEAGDRVPELGQRAASDFTSFAVEEQKLPSTKVAELTGDKAKDTEDGKDKKDQKDAQAKDAKKDKDAAKKPALARGTDVTFLLDTSDAMGVVEGDARRLDVVRGALHSAFQRVGDNEGAVSLWNYSSQLSPGARTPYRVNVDLSARDGGAAAGAVLDQLNVGGGNHANVSISAAHKAAVDSAAAGSGKPAGRMVVVLAGKNQDELSVEQLKAQLAAANPQVRVDIVGIGGDVAADELARIAEATGGKFYPARDAKAVDGVLKGIV